jgi:hypothetical protein
MTEPTQELPIDLGRQERLDRVGHCGGLAEPESTG